MIEKNNKNGYILIEIAVFIIIISMLCISLATIISNKVSLNQKDRATQNLYITAKSTLNTLAKQFKTDKALLKEYAQKKEKGTIKILNRDDISSIQFNVSESLSKGYAILEVIILDNLKNKLTLKTEIKY